MAYNNDTFLFYSDSLDASSADITIQESLVLKLYPNPSGVFYTNLRPYIAALINTQNFADIILTDLQTGIPESFVYPSNEGRYLRATVDFKVIQNNENETYTDSTSYDIAWLAAVQQHGNFRVVRKQDFVILTPLTTNTTNKWYVKYWEGYPFDICIYNNRRGIKLKNTSNLIEDEFTTEEECSRLFFSDGRTDTTLEDFIPLNTGTNNLQITRENDSNYYEVTIDKAEGCSGVYLKWFNAQGGYSYWLFEKTYAIDRTIKELGELERDFENLENSAGPTTQIGRQVQDTLKIVAELLTPAQRNIVQNLLESPKVFLFTGTPYGRTSYKDWIEVSVKTNSVRIKNPREELTNFAFDIALPERYTITL